MRKEKRTYISKILAYLLSVSMIFGTLSVPVQAKEVVEGTTEGADARATAKDTKETTAGTDFNPAAMTAPVIKKVTVRDVSVSIDFTPSTGVAENPQGTKPSYYEIELVDNTSGDIVKTQKLSGESRAAEDCTYRITDANAEGTLLNCAVSGLQPNKGYKVTVIAVCRDNDKSYTKESKVQKFTTLKQLLTDSDSLPVNWVSLEELYSNPDSKGEAINYENTLSLEIGKEYALLAQISNLSRALETDKLKWTVTAGDKKAASIKVGKSTYEARITTKKAGDFTITATSTLTKEPLAVIQISVGMNAQAKAVLEYRPEPAALPAKEETL